jgi:hypothetical protein
MKLKKRIIITVSILMGGIIYCAFMFFIFLFIFNFNLKDYFFPEKFDSFEWVSSYERYQNSHADGMAIYNEFSNRKKMVYSLIRSQELIGKNMDQVKEILGTDGEQSDSKQWDYWIDFTVADNKWLTVKFNNDTGLVDFVGITED